MSNAKEPVEIIPAPTEQKEQVSTVFCGELLERLHRQHAIWLDEVARSPAPVDKYRLPDTVRKLVARGLDSLPRQ